MLLKNSSNIIAITNIHLLKSVTITFRNLNKMDGIDVVAINDITDVPTLVHLLKFDSVHGRFDGDVSVEGTTINVNGESIKVSAREKLSESLLATGFPYYNFEQMSAYLKILNEFMQSTHGLRRMGSAAVDLAYVACGRFEGFFEYNLNAWDVAAGSLIVKEAGGEVTDFNLGSNFLFGREIIAGGNVLKEMQTIIAKHWN